MFNDWHCLIKMWLCEGKLKVKISLLQLPSASQKRACLSSLMLFLSYLVKNIMDRVYVMCKLVLKWYLMRMCASWLCPFKVHSPPQRPRSFWSAPRIATSGRVQHRKSAIHELPVTLRTLRVKSDKSDWFWSQSIVFTKPFKSGMSLEQARGSKAVKRLGTRVNTRVI